MIHGYQPQGECETPPTNPPNQGSSGKRPVDDRDIVIAELLDAVKYLLRDDRTAAEQKLASADQRFRRAVLR